MIRMELAFLPTYVFAFLILSILLIGAVRHPDAHASLIGGRLFRQMILGNMVLLLADGTQVLIDGMAGGFWQGFNYSVCLVQYLAAIFLTASWVRYVVFFIHKDTAPLQRVTKWLFITAIPYLFLCGMSLFGDFIFHIDEANIYHRGAFFWVYLAMVFSHFFFSIGTTMIYRKKIRKAELVPILIFAIPSVLGGVLQVLFYGLLLVWPMTTLSVFMIYIFVQNEKATTDFLTGLFNKREFESDLTLMERTPWQNQKLAGMIADLDHFKQINDQFGHDVGDEVLRATSDLLRKSFGVNDIIARIGGDEFGVLLQCDNDKALQGIIDGLNQRIEEFNRTQRFAFDIRLSIGADIFRSSQDASVRDFVKRLDEMMYENKKRAA